MGNIFLAIKVIFETTQTRKKTNFSDYLIPCRLLLSLEAVIRRRNHCKEATSCHFSERAKERHKQIFDNVTKVEKLCFTEVLFFCFIFQKMS